MFRLGSACALVCLATACGDDEGGKSDAGDDTLVGVGIEVHTAAARSCELIIEDPQQGLTGVEFDDSVIGRSVRQGSRTAVAMLRKADGAFGGGAAQLQARGSAAADALELGRVDCFDRDGKPIESPSVSLKR